MKDVSKKVKKEKVSIETIPFKLNLPCEATKKCQGRIEQASVGKIIRSQEPKTGIKTARIEVESRTKRCSVCFKLNQAKSLLVSWND